MSAAYNILLDELLQKVKAGTIEWRNSPDRVSEFEKKALDSEEHEREGRDTVYQLRERVLADIDKGLFLGKLEEEIEREKNKDNDIQRSGTYFYFFGDMAKDENWKKLGRKEKLAKVSEYVEKKVQSADEALELAKQKSQRLSVKKELAAEEIELLDRGLRERTAGLSSFETQYKGLILLLRANPRTSFQLFFRYHNQRQVSAPAEFEDLDDLRSYITDPSYGTSHFNNHRALSGLGKASETFVSLFYDAAKSLAIATNGHPDSKSVNDSLLLMLGLFRTEGVNVAIKGNNQLEGRSGEIGSIITVQHKDGLSVKRATRPKKGAGVNAESLES